MDTSTGRFISMDTYQGSTADPISLHKYLYANSNPVTYSDPSGYMSLMGEVAVNAIIDIMISGTIGGSVSLGMSIIKGLTEAKNAQQKFQFGSEQVMAFIEGFLFGALFGCIGMLAASLELGILYLALGVTGLIGACGALKAGGEAFENGDYLLAGAYFTLAGLSIWGAGKCFNAAGDIVPNRTSSNNSVSKFIEENVNENFQKNVADAFTDNARVSILEQDLIVYR